MASGTWWMIPSCASFPPHKSFPPMPICSSTNNENRNNLEKNKKQKTKNKKQKAKSKKQKAKSKKQKAKSKKQKAKSKKQKAKNKTWSNKIKSWWSNTSKTKVIKSKVESLAALYFVSYELHMNYEIIWWKKQMLQTIFYSGRKEHLNIAHKKCHIQKEFHCTQDCLTTNNLSLKELSRGGGVEKCWWNELVIEF